MTAQAKEVASKAIDAASSELHDISMKVEGRRRWKEEYHSAKGGTAI
jgi:hypothetical protein